MTYNFPQFALEIVNPIVKVDSDNITIHATRSTIDLFVTLETANSKLRGVKLINIPVDNLSFEGEANLMVRAIEGLDKYKI